jgi:integrase
MAKLTARTVETIKTPGMHADGGNLYLCVGATGSKSWIFRWKRDGKVREMGLGSVSLVGLAEARRKAEEARGRLGQGLDPLDTRKAEEAARMAAGCKRTFGEAADAFIEAKMPEWRNEKHRAQWQMTLGETYCSAIRGKRVDEIETADVLAVLKPIWQSKPETASRLRGRVEAVLDAARAKGHISKNEANPARWRGHLDKLLPKRQKLARGHHPAIAFDEMPAFVSALRQREGIAGMALEFAILTAARSGEVRGATWSEFDLSKKIWTIQAARTKPGREHRVPLCERAIGILMAVKPLTGGTAAALVFPGKAAGKPLSDMSLSAVLRRMGHADLTVHGFRSTFRDWAGEATNFAREIAEAALAHVIGDKAEQAYRRGDALEKRRKLMEAWAAYCEPKAAANVLPLR